MKTLFAWLAFLAGTCILLGLVRAQLTPANLLFTNDLAVSLAVGDAAIHGDFPLSGPPSHLGGRSIGPVYYGYVALSQVLGGREPLHAAAAMLLLNIFFVLAIMRLWPDLKSTAGYAGAAALAMLVWVATPMMLALVTPWHGYFIAFPALLFGVCLYRYLTHGRRELPLLLFASTIYVQTSLSGIPLAAGMLLPAFFLREVFSRPAASAATGTHKRWTAWLFLGAAAALWIPPILYELMFRPNMLTVLYGHDARPLPSRAGAGAAFELLYRFALDWVATPRVPWEAWVIRAASALSLITLVIQTLRRATRPARDFMICIFFALLLYPAALMLVPAPLHSYYLAPLWAPLLCAAVLLLRQGFYGAKVSAIIFSTILLFSATQRIRTLPYQPPPRESLAHAQQLSTIIANDAGSDRPVALQYAGETRLVQNGTLYLLGPENYPFMQYHTAFMEMDSLRKRTKEAKRRYVMVCPADFPLRKQGSASVREIPLASCATCAGCRLLRSPG